MQRDYADHAFFYDIGPVYASFHPPATPGWALVNPGLVPGLTSVALVLMPLTLRWREGEGRRR